MTDPTAIPPGLVTHISPRSVAATVERLLGMLRAKEIKVFAVIDHSGEARATGSSCATQRL
ncbi:MAG: hypothetical protein ACRDNJ_09240 [Solirubrobacteraceae bacterium]